MSSDTNSVSNPIRGQSAISSQNSCSCCAVFIDSYFTVNLVAKSGMTGGVTLPARVDFGYPFPRTSVQPMLKSPSCDSDFNAVLTSPELLVSVKSVEEFWILTAIDDIDIIDLKDPGRGALAPTSAELWNQVADLSNQVPLGSAEVGRCQSLSAALGEFDQADRCVEQLPPEFQFAKMGPSGCRATDLLRQRWQSISERLPKSTELVAVAYADFASANSPAPLDVLHCAMDRGMNRILIDTFNKDGRTSIDHLGFDALQEFAKVSRGSNVWWSLAGSIDLRHIDQLLSIGVHPHCIGVRGAVCEGDREQSLSEDKCRQFCQTVANWESRGLRDID